MIPFVVFLVLVITVSKTVSDLWYTLFKNSKNTFEGKVAIITGSSRGIGRTIAYQLASAGAKVVLNGRDASYLEQVGDEFRKAGYDVLTCPADITNQNDCRRLIASAYEKYGGIDILVNNAGVGFRGFFEDTCPEVFRTLLNVNVIGSVLPTMAALPFLKDRRGSILFISSLAGLRGIPNTSPYSMTKMAQTSLAESLRVELFNSRVHVGIVYVGKTENDLHKQVVLANGKYQSLKKANPLFVDTQNEVAKTVLRSIQGRMFKTTVGLKGTLYFHLLRFVPGFVDFMFRRKLEYIKNAEH